MNAIEVKWKGINKTVGGALVEAHLRLVLKLGLTDTDFKGVNHC